MEKQHGSRWETLCARRLERWGQTPETRIPGADAAVAFIERVGVATLFPASPEIPNLFHAYMGDPDAPISSKHDSPSGHVYTWRWTLGRREAAFYTAIVRNRPTWASWTLLPAILCLCGERRIPEELYEVGELSMDAHRIARTLAAAGGVLTTGELRRRAGFPTGKEQRAAYLKAVEELDTRLLLAKVFSPDDLEMHHALVSVRYPEHAAVARHMAREEALDRCLRVYLPHAVYAAPAPLARHLKLPETDLRAGLDRLVAANLAELATLPGYKGICYIYTGVV